MSSPRRHLLAATLAASLIAPSSRAAPSAAEPTYKDAVRAEASGDVVGALAKFESIPPASRDVLVRLHIASCKRKLARFLDSARDLEAILADPTIDQATRETAQSDLDDLHARTPKLLVRLSAATSGVVVTLDGRTITPPATEPVDPGTHAIVAKRGDRKVFEREVFVVESTSIDVEIDAPAPLVAAPSEATSAPASVATAPTPTPTATSRRDGDDFSGQRVAGWILVGAGGLAGIGAFGARRAADSAYHDWQYSCAIGPCDDAAKSRTRTWDAFTVTGVATAVLGVGLGVVLVVTTPRSDHAVEVRATTGAVNGISIVGRF